MRRSLVRTCPCSNWYFGSTYNLATSALVTVTLAVVRLQCHCPRQTESGRLPSSSFPLLSVFSPWCPAHQLGDEIGFLKPTKIIALRGLKVTASAILTILQVVVIWRTSSSQLLLTIFLSINILLLLVIVVLLLILSTVSSLFSFFFVFVCWRDNIHHHYY